MKLASAPLSGCLPSLGRAFVLSEDNPWYSKGLGANAISGVGGQHVSTQPQQSAALYCVLSSLLMSEAKG